MTLKQAHVINRALVQCYRARHGQLPGIQISALRAIAVIPLLVLQSATEQIEAVNAQLLADKTSTYPPEPYPTIDDSQIQSTKTWAEAHYTKGQ